jgi:hypothetical protein
MNTVLELDIAFQGKEVKGEDKGDRELYQLTGCEKLGVL